MRQGGDATRHGGDATRHGGSAVALNSSILAHSGNYSSLQTSWRVV